MSSSPLAVPVPINDPIATPRNWQKYPHTGGKRDPEEGRITRPWVDFFTVSQQAQSVTPTLLVGVHLTAQTASIAATPFSTPALSAASYRITYYFRVTTAASISSSLLVTLSWTQGGVSCSKSFAAVTGNTTATTDSGSYTVTVDQASPINYATTYASVGTPMAYSLDVFMETIPA